MLGFDPLGVQPLGASGPSAVVVTAVRFYADADLSVGAWQSTDVSLFAAVDEATPSDADYIYTSSPSTANISLQGVTDPGVDTGFSVYYRAKGRGGLTSLSVALKQGATVIASETRSLTETETTYRLELTPAQAAAITDFTNLSVELGAI